jgi:hypothetical protein
LGHCPFNTFSSLFTGIGKGQWVENQERRQQSLKQEEKIIRAQKRRINEKSLILSEFSTGFQATIVTPRWIWPCFPAVFRIRIWIRIHMFLGLPDPKPLVIDMDSDPDPLLSSSKNNKNLDSYCFVTSFGFFIFEILCKCTFKKYNNFFLLVFCWRLEGQ